MSLDTALASALDDARAGDEAAMREVFVALHPRLLRYIGAREHRMADDLTAEVWLAVAVGLPSFEGDAEAFRAWVFSIARRRIADHRRKGVRRATDPIDPTRLEVHRASDDTAGEAVAATSAQEAADLVVALLPPDQADVVLLRILGELDVERVAELLGRSANWVRVTQHRALRRLADRLTTKMGVIR